MSGRCASGRFGCAGQPITAAELHVGDRVAVMASIENGKPVPVVGHSPFGAVLVESPRHGRYAVYVNGACSCIVEPAQ